jgi:hypothetical protein
MFFSFFLVLSHENGMYKHEEADEDEEIDVEFSPSFETEEPIKRHKRISGWSLNTF